MIIDSDGNRLNPSGEAIRRPPFSVWLTWALSLLALVVGVAAAMAFALWIALILIPLAIIASGLASIFYRLQLARLRKNAAVAPRF